MPSPMQALLGLSQGPGQPYDHERKGIRDVYDIDRNAMQNDVYIDSSHSCKVNYQNKASYKEKMVNYEGKSDETNLKFMKQLHNKLCLHILRSERDRHCTKQHAPLQNAG